MLDTQVLDDFNDAPEPVQVSNKRILIVFVITLFIQGVLWSLVTSETITRLSPDMVIARILGFELKILMLIIWGVMLVPSGLLVFFTRMRYLSIWKAGLLNLSFSLLSIFILTLLVFNRRNHIFDLEGFIRILIQDLRPISIVMGFQLVLLLGAYLIIHRRFWYLGVILLLSVGYLLHIVDL